jgi:hypothetical protein
LRSELTIVSFLRFILVYTVLSETWQRKRQFPPCAFQDKLAVGAETAGLKMKPDMFAGMSCVCTETDPLLYGI